jgi:hypothetical protein
MKPSGAAGTTPVPESEPGSHSQKLYKAAKARLGRHLTLDPSVSPDDGCAECVSVLLKATGFPDIPLQGFAGTVGLNAFLDAHPVTECITMPEPGAIIVSVTDAPNEGHIGVFAMFGVQYAADWAIMSNDSTTGTLREHWNYKGWQNYYRQELGLQTFIYRWVG